MTLSAYVQNVSSEPINTIQDSAKGGSVAIAQKLVPAWVEIIEDEAGVSLFRYCSEGNYISDTWHATVEDAKHQAEQEFQIRDEHWFEE